MLHIFLLVAAWFLWLFIVYSMVKQASRDFTRNSRAFKAQPFNYSKKGYL
jgi:hypothetical protein